MWIRSLFLGISFILFESNFSLGLCQENPESRVRRLLTQIYSLPNTPKLSPIKVIIDKTKKQSDAYYIRYPKKFFGLKKDRTPEVHLSTKYAEYNTDNAILVTLAHELGHHFDTRLKLYFERGSPLDQIIENYDRTKKGQYFAEAFALYILGEDLYKIGRLEGYLTDLKDMGVNWLYIEQNPILYKYYMDIREAWVNYWLEGARSMLDDVTRLINMQLVNMKRRP